MRLSVCFLRSIHRGGCGSPLAPRSLWRLGWGRQLVQDGSRLPESGKLSQRNDRTACEAAGRWRTRRWCEVAGRLAALLTMAMAAPAGEQDGRWLPVPRGVGAEGSIGRRANDHLQRRGRASLPLPLLLLPHWEEERVLAAATTRCHCHHRRTPPPPPLAALLLPPPSLLAPPPRRRHHCRYMFAAAARPPSSPPLPPRQTAAHFITSLGSLPPVCSLLLCGMQRVVSGSARIED